MTPSNFISTEVVSPQEASRAMATVYLKRHEQRTDTCKSYFIVISTKSAIEHYVSFLYSIVTQLQKRSVIEYIVIFSGERKGFIVEQSDMRKYASAYHIEENIS